jgi:hypothetical protein
MEHRETEVVAIAEEGGTGYYHEGMVDRAALPSDRVWVPVSGNPWDCIATPGLALLRTKRIEELLTEIRDELRRPRETV